MAAAAEGHLTDRPHVVGGCDRFTVIGATFKLSYTVKRPDHVELAMGPWVQRFLVPSSCDTMDGPDVTGELVSRSHTVKDDGVLLRFDYPSTSWEQKSCFVLVRPRYVEYWYRVKGRGALDTLRYFECVRPTTNRPQFLAAKHLNDGRESPYRDLSQASPVAFTTVFTPEPNSYGHQLLAGFEAAQVSVNADLDYAGGNFQFNPGLLCFVLGHTDEGPWLTAGLAVRPGNHQFSEFEYVGGRQFGFNLNYWGATDVDGWFETPHLILRPTDTPLDGCREYADHLRACGLVDSHSKSREKWWAGPLVDGWGHQCYMADLFRRRSPPERPKDTAAYFMSTQAHYRDLVEQLEARKLPWKILTVNARWFLYGGRKEFDIGRWPDVRAFVDWCHGLGKRVLIWWSPWDTDGIPPEECIRYSEQATRGKRNRPGRTTRFRPLVDGACLAPDVTLRSVRQRMREQIERALTPEGEGWNFDGLRLDHVGITPGLYGLVFPEHSRRLVGIELLRACYDLLYETAKQVRPDALVVGQSPNPYFANCIDMQTIGDLYSPDARSVNDHAELRARLIGAADDGWLIEMHGWPLPSVDAMRKYVALQCQLGVPTLYYLSHLDTTGEPLTDELFGVVAASWADYCRQNGV